MNEATTEFVVLVFVFLRHTSLIMPQKAIPQSAVLGLRYISKSEASNTASNVIDAAGCNENIVDCMLSKSTLEIFNAVKKLKNYSNNLRKILQKK